MATDILRLDVARRRRSIIGYCVGLAAYALIVVILYPTFKNSTSLDSFVRQNAAAAALFGVTGTLTSSDGWLNANIYGNFLPLIMLLMTVGYGAASIAGQDEDGTLCLIATLPVRREAVVVQKAGAMTLQAGALAAAIAVCVVIGRSFDLTVSVANITGVSSAVLLMGVDVGLIAMAIGAATGRRGTAIGISASVAAGSYLASSLAPVASWLSPIRYASVFYWAVGNNQIASGVSPADYAVLLGVGVAVLAGAVIAFRRLGVR